MSVRGTMAVTTVGALGIQALIVWGAWGNWWAVAALSLVNFSVAWLCLAEDMRDYRREQRWSTWVNEHTTIRK